MTQPGVPAHAVVASAPGRVALAGSGGGPWLSVALDRRATCRVEPLAAGVEVEAKEALTRIAARDVAELAVRHPGSVAAQVLQALGASGGLRVVTESKLPAGSGLDLGAALSLATTAAVSRALGRAPTPEELVAQAREASRRAGQECGHGLHAALWGGLVVTRERDGGLEAERPSIDPGRVEESLLLVDVPPDAEAATGATAGGAAASNRTAEVVDALTGSRFEDLVELLRDGPAEAGGGGSRQRVVGLVRSAGGAARGLEGRLVLVWAPPGARGPGRREAVEEALRSGGFKPLPLRLDLAGLELD